MSDEQATELEWLRWFYGYADFGPSDGDVRAALKARFTEKTGKALPAGYEDES